MTPLPSGRRPTPLRPHHHLMLMVIPLAGLCACHRPPTQAPPAPAVSVTPGFVSIRAGSFIMGSPDDEAARYHINEDRHPVSLTHDFEIAITEVTQEGFQKVMGYNPSRLAACPTCPVETVSWSEAAAYCNALSQKSGLALCYACDQSGPSVSCDVAPAFAGAKIYDCPGYRLPTDAEWEHAYRAGTSTPYYNGSSEAGSRLDCSRVDPVTDEIGWYCANSGKKAHPVAQKKPNAWGLYDMSGNVWEWCNDWYQPILGTNKVTDPWGAPSSPTRVARGGAWDYYARGMRAAARAWYSPSYRGTRNGFRPARSRRAAPWRSPKA